MAYALMGLAGLFSISHFRNAPAREQEAFGGILSSLSLDIEDNRITFVGAMVSIAAIVWAFINN